MCGLELINYRYWWYTFGREAEQHKRICRNRASGMDWKRVYTQKDKSEEEALSDLIFLTMESQTTWATNFDFQKRGSLWRLLPLTICVCFAINLRSYEIFFLISFDECAAVWRSGFSITWTSRAIHVVLVPNKGWQQTVQYAISLVFL